MPALPSPRDLAALGELLTGPAPAPAPPRAWAVTPFNRSQLPSFAAGEGIDRLLGGEPELHLTAFPVRWGRQVPVPAMVSKSGVRDEPLALRGPLGILGPAFAAGTNPEICAGDGVWVLQLDDRGQLLERYRGRAAAVLTR